MALAVTCIAEKEGTRQTEGHEGKGRDFGVDLQSHSSGDADQPLAAQGGALSQGRAAFMQLPLLTLPALPAAESVRE